MKKRQTCKQTVPIVPSFTYRTGIGFDVHGFDKSTISEDNHVVLCGIQISHIYRLSAHSDGDVALHALTDAMLGAVAAGSIGLLFPPTDIQWKGASSKIFVKHANSAISERKGIISNIDMIIICEIPKVMPHALEMRENVANMLNLSLDQVHVKAVTTEKLGALGRKEGIAAQVVCTVMLPYT
ncbi:2-C-methyl-D-erythritol 2,4-cyclodiphosphate synthase [Alphaproteobacteria bacterium]